MVSEHLNWPKVALRHAGDVSENCDNYGDLAATSSASTSSLSLASFLTHTNAYLPKVGDHVIGIVVSKNQDFYTLDIGAIHEAVLFAIDGFRGATKRNRPNLNEGDVVFCQVVVYNANLQQPCQVSCINANDSKQWTSGEAYFGPLENGFLFSVDLAMAVGLSLPNSSIFNTLGRHAKFETCVGLNARVWIKASDAVTSVRIARFIRRCHGLSPAQIEALYNLTADEMVAH